MAQIINTKDGTKLLTNAVATGAGPSFDLKGHQNATVDINVLAGGVATIKVQVSADDANWANAATVTFLGTEVAAENSPKVVQSVVLGGRAVRFVRCNVTAWTSGTYNADLTANGNPDFRDWSPTG